MSKETTVVFMEDLAKECSLLQELEEIKKQEEIYWRQRSRVNWLKEGDVNTKCFHVVANRQRIRNFIPSLTQGGPSL